GDAVVLAPGDVCLRAHRRAAGGGAAGGAGGAGAAGWRGALLRRLVRAPGHRAVAGLGGRWRAALRLSWLGLWPRRGVHEDPGPVWGQHSAAGPAAGLPGGWGATGRPRPAG